MAQFFGSNYRSLHCFMQSKRVHPAFHKSLDGQAAWSHGVAETVRGLGGTSGIGTEMRIDAVVRSPLKEKGTEWNCDVITQRKGARQAFPVVASWCRCRGLDGDGGGFHLCHHFPPFPHLFSICL